MLGDRGASRSRVLYYRLDFQENRKLHQREEEKHISATGNSLSFYFLNEKKKENEIELSIEEQIAKKTVPWAGNPYSEQLMMKNSELHQILMKMTNEIKKNNPSLKEFIEKNETVNDGLICPFLDVIPSPVVDKYRNKCEFTFGKNPSGDLTLGFLLGLVKEGYSAVIFTGASF